MSEEQFWNSNPRIIAVHEKAFREHENRKNSMNHILGIYMYEAVGTVLGNAFRKKGQEAIKFRDKPIPIFEPTKEEKDKAEKTELQKFMGWTGAVESKSKIIIAKK